MFAKIFVQILDSSLAENWQTRLVFEDLLKLCGCDGIVDMTHEAIARRTNVPIEIVRAAISELEKPDPKSRTPDANGVRIVRLDEHRDWGWAIVNFAKFRAIASEEQRKAGQRKRFAKWKETHCDVKVNKLTRTNAANASLTPPNASNAIQKQKQKQKQSTESGGAAQSIATEQTSKASRIASEPTSNASSIAERPSLAEVLAYADQTGLLPWKAEDWFNEMEGCGWLDYNRRPIAKWQSVLNRVRVKWEADGRPKAPPTNQGFSKNGPPGNQSGNDGEPQRPGESFKDYLARGLRNAL